MTKWERVVCTKCGERTAMSIEHAAHIRDAWHAPFPPSPPPVTPNICARCAMQDPSQRAEFEAWLKENEKYVSQRAREMLARPLEVIDELVARFM